MFTAEQIDQKLSKVKTGADFPELAYDLRSIGVTYYETKMEDGTSVYHGPNNHEIFGGPKYKTIEVLNEVNLEKLKLDIENHQQGKSDYFEISQQCAENGIAKWAVCLISMTCTYIDKFGKKVWVEQIPIPPDMKQVFTADQIKAAHGKVKSGADFPAYIKEIKAMGVIQYETYVTDGHIDYHGKNSYIVKIPPKYEPLIIAEIVNKNGFEIELRAHQQGKTDFLTFIKAAATYGIEKWQINMDQLTCTYFDKDGREVLVEEIPI